MSPGPSTADPLVEVVVPFVRGTPHLLDAVRSVIAQTEPGWRLTVVDNAGPEPEAADAVAELGDDRVVYRRFDEHIPMADNWNRCASIVTAPWFALLHADDEWEPGYVTEMHRLIGAGTGAAAHFTGGHTIDEHGATTFSLADWYKARLRGRGDDDLHLHGDRGLAHLLRGNYVFASSLCLETSTFGSDPYSTDLRFAPDYEVLLRYLLDGGTVVGSRQDLCRYRRHAGQETLALEKESVRFDEELELYERYRQTCRERGWQRSERAARNHLSLRANLLVHAAQGVVRGQRSAAWSTAKSAVRTR